MPFSQFKFHPQVADGLATLGYEVPTPIQTQSIPPVMAGKDVLGLAQTGTGKTAAFALPMLHRLMNGPRGVLRALIIAPTRELAEQTHDFIMSLAPHTGLRSATIYGGVGMHPQIETLRKGIDIVVACPGRLLDHLKSGTAKLNTVQILVIDEADRMFDMGFLPDIRRVLQYVPQQRQTLLYSATMPDDVRKLVRDVLHDEVVVQIGFAAPAETVAHAFYPVSQHLKTALLLAVLKRTTTGSVLVFTRTKHRAKRVARQLRQAGYAAAELQGNLSQNRRQEALDGFRDGTYKIMVATDIAARGIDVSLISHVVNYDVPDTADAYTHRIGRTGRAERTGEAFTFITDEDTADVREIEKKLKQRIERRMVEGFDYHQAPPPREERVDYREPRQPSGRRRPALPHAARPAATGPRPEAVPTAASQPRRSDGGQPAHAQRPFPNRDAQPQPARPQSHASRRDGQRHDRRQQPGPAAPGQPRRDGQQEQQHDSRHRNQQGARGQRDGQRDQRRGSQTNPRRNEPFTILKKTPRTQPLGNFIPTDLKFESLDD
ncbi:MAG TPA: DEAD/DEAH box helicase [bacterium]|nr:DEAD/DEAH box helicase [bacterium]